jgi:hypothetical protein
MLLPTHRDRSTHGIVVPAGGGMRHAAEPSADTYSSLHRTRYSCYWHCNKVSSCRTTGYAATRALPTLLDAPVSAMEIEMTMQVKMALEMTASCSRSLSSRWMCR